MVLVYIPTTYVKGSPIENHPPPSAWQSCQWILLLPYYVWLDV